MMIVVATWSARQSEREVNLKARQLQLTLEHMSQGIMMVAHDLEHSDHEPQCAPNCSICLMTS